METETWQFLSFSTSPEIKTQIKTTKIMCLNHLWAWSGRGRRRFVDLQIAQNRRAKQRRNSSVSETLRAVSFCPFAETEPKGGVCQGFAGLSIVSIVVLVVPAPSPGIMYVTRREAGKTLQGARRHLISLDIVRVGFLMLPYAQPLVLFFFAKLKELEQNDSKYTYI